MPGVPLTLLVNLEDLLKAQLEKHPEVSALSLHLEFQTQQAVLSFSLLGYSLVNEV